MKQLLIVEDEAIEREFIQKIISNDFHNNYEVYACENGTQAIEVFKENKIDIVFMDINLPGMNGLEVLQKMKRMRPDFISYIITSHSKFEYAYDAIKLGVQDYIIKPTTKKSIHVLLHQLIRDTPKMQPKQQEVVMHEAFENFLYLLLSRPSYQKIYKQILKLELDSSKLRLFISYQLSDTNLMDIISVLNTHAIKHCVQSFGPLCFIVYEDTSEVSKPIKNSITNCSSIILDFNENYALLYQRELRDYIQSLLPSLNVQYLDASHIKNNIEKLNNKAEYILYLNYLTLELFPNSNGTLLEFYTNLRDMVSTVNVLNNNFLPVNSNFGNSFEGRSRFIDIQMTLNHLLENYYIAFSQKTISSEEKIIRDATSYIKKHFSENISLDDLADHLMLSTHHISKVLSSKGCSFTKILNQIRIEEAKKLLRTNISIKEISHIVGYQSINYFSRVFKKYVGIPPNQFRNSI